MSRLPKLTDQVIGGLSTALGAWLAGEHDEDDDVEAVRAADAWLEAVVGCGRRKGGHEMDEQIIRTALLRASEDVLGSLGIEIDHEKGVLSADLQSLPRLAPGLPVERLIALARAVSAARRIWPREAK